MDETPIQTFSFGTLDSTRAIIHISSICRSSPHHSIFMDLLTPSRINYLYISGLLVLLFSHPRPYSGQEGLFLTCDYSRMSKAVLQYTLAISSYASSFPSSGPGIPASLFELSSRRNCKSIGDGSFSETARCCIDTGGCWNTAG